MIMATWRVQGQPGLRETIYLNLLELLYIPHICMYVCHAHAQCLWRPEGIRSPGTGVKDGGDPL